MPRGPRGEKRPANVIGAAGQLHCPCAPNKADLTVLEVNSFGSQIGSGYGGADMPLTGPIPEGRTRLDVSRVLAPLDRGQIYCTRGSKRPTAYPERGGVVLIHPRDLCIQQYLGK